MTFMVFSSVVNAQNALVLNKLDGDSVAYLIDEIKCIVFSADQYQVIMSDETSTDFTYDETANLLFSQWEKPTSSVSDIEKVDNAQLSLYPNPTNDILFVNWQTEKMQNLKVEIIDIKGKVVYLKTDLSSNTLESIDLNQLSKGLYFCRIYNTETVLTKKIIKN